MRMKILIVTPARNEALNLPRLAASLRFQTKKFEYVWVVVDDNSTDNTSEIFSGLELPFETHSLATKSTGKLISGGAYYTWWKGVDYGLKIHPECKYVLKIDADVILSSFYFEYIFEAMELEPDVVGGVISGSGREQRDFVPGPVKMYSARALHLIRNLPVATGFDVMDEALCRMNGFTTFVDQRATFEFSRPIGFSQGKLHGRFRNGLVCRWTGYAPEYFVLHLSRYVFRRPFILGAIWMLFGFLTAGPGPYDSKVKKYFRKIQRKRLLRILINPITMIKNLYGLR